MRKVLWSRKTVLTFAFCSFQIFFGGSAIAGERYDENVLNLFDSITMSSEIGAAADNRLIRWTQPVRIAALSESNDHPYHELITDVATQFSRETGHPIHTKAKSDINMVFIFADDIYTAAKSRYRNYFEKFVSNKNNIDSYIESNKQRKETWFIHAVLEPYAIRGGIIFISKRQTRSALRRSVIRAMARAMGLLGVFHTKQDSLLFVRSHQRDLTPLDRSLLRTLYDRRLESGMTRSQVLSILRGRRADLPAIRRQFENG